MAAGASGQLAAQYVEFVTKGLQELQDGLDIIKGNLSLVDDAGKALGDHINAAFSSMAAKLIGTKAEVIALEGALTSGKYEQFAKSMTANAAALEKLQAQAKLVDLQAALEFKDPYTVSEMQKINSELALMQKRSENMDLRIGVNLGTLQTAQEEMAKLNAEARELERPLKVGLQLEGMANAVEDARIRFDALKASIASGDYQRNAVELDRLANATKKLAEQAIPKALAAPSATTWASWAATAIGKVGSVAQSLTQTLGSAIQNVQARIANPIAIGAAVAGFQLLTNAAHSWVNAGLAGTIQGNALSLQFTLLSQQIAGVFVPTINLVIRGIETLTGWFRSLNGEQQGMIRRWVEAAAVMVVVSQVAGRLGGVVTGVITSIITGIIGMAGMMVATVIPAISTLVTAVVTGSGVAGAALNLAFAGIPIILGLIGMVVSALASLGIAGLTMGAGIAVGTQTGRSALASLFQSFGPVLAMIRETFAAVTGILGPALEQIGDKLAAAFGGIDSGPLRAMIGQLVDVLASAVPVVVAIASGVISVVSWIIRAGMAAVEFVNQFGGIKIILAAVAGLAATFAAGILAIAAPFIALGVVIAAALVPVVVVLGVIGAVIGGIVYVIVRVVQAVWPLVDAFMRIGRAVYSLVAAVVGPLIRAVVSLVSAFLGMSGVGGIFEGILGVLGKVAEFIANTLITQVKNLLVFLMKAADAFADMNELAGNKKTAAMFRDIANAMEDALIAMTDNTKKKKKGSDEKRTDVSSVGGQFEQAQDLFKRIQEAAIKTDAQKQIELAQQQLAVAQQIAKNTTPANQFPPVGTGNAATSGVWAGVQQALFGPAGGG